MATRVQKPGSVTAASVLWIIFGSLAMASMMLYERSRGSGMLNFAVGLSFIIVGIRTMSGKMSSVFGAGIVCIVVAAIAIGDALATPAATNLSPIMFAFMLASSGLMLSSGVLALVGDAKYKQWRMATMPMRRMPVSPSSPRGY